MILNLVVKSTIKARQLKHLCICKSPWQHLKFKVSISAMISECQTYVSVNFFK